MALSCKLGKHEFELREATFSSAVLCSKCDKPENEDEAALYLYEMEQWAHGDAMGWKYAQKMVYVLRNMAELIQPGA